MDGKKETCEECVARVNAKYDYEMQRLDANLFMDILAIIVIVLLFCMLFVKSHN